MSNQPTQQPVALRFARDEWDLLVALPRRVLVAATSVRAGPNPPTAAESIAGMEAIAAGRGSPSRLVRDVVAAIYAEHAAEVPTGEWHPDPQISLPRTLQACRRAIRVLDTRADPADSVAYRGWLMQIAAATGAPERHFLDDLGQALGR